MLTAHYTRYNDCTLHTEHCTLNAAHGTLTAHCTVCTLQVCLSIAADPDCDHRVRIQYLNIIHRTLYTVHRTLYTVHCTLYTVHCTLYCIVHCSIVHCTVYSLHCTLYTVYCTLYIIQCTLYTVSHPFTEMQTAHPVDCRHSCRVFLTLNGDKFSNINFLVRFGAETWIIFLPVDPWAASAEPCNSTSKGS